jgi:hypothetical protein
MNIKMPRNPQVAITAARKVSAPFSARPAQANSSRLEERMTPTHPVRIPRTVAAEAASSPTMSRIAAPRRHRDLPRRPHGAG